MNWRWLAVVGVSALLPACTDVFPPCPAPGGVNTRNAQETCYYLLTVQQTDPEVRGIVARSVVEDSIKRIPFLDDNWTYEKDYQVFQFPIPLYDPNDKLKLVIGNDYWFVSKPGTPLLQVKADNELPKHDNEVPRSSMTMSDGQKSR